MGLFNAAILWAILGGGAPNTVRSTDTLTSSAKTREDPAVVQVFSPISRGTGFFIEGGGRKYLVTAAHVCGSFKFLVSAKGVHNVLASSPRQDICVLSTYQNVTALKLAPDSNPGDKVNMTGFPLDFIYDYQEGTVKGPGFSVFKMPVNYYGLGCPETSLPVKDGCAIYITTVQMQILSRPGNSGGPVVNTNNEVVGILIATDNQGYGYMAPVSELLKVLTGQP